tara:strand:- start:397 stop:1053 length:657 start_codon:yes stop_codon:yes gene_type:complete
LKFSIINEFNFDKDKAVGYLSDFSQFQNEIDKIKLHEETIPNNEISSDVDIDNFEPIVLSLYPEENVDSHTKTLETEKLILLDGHHRWKYANKKNLVNKLKCILINFKDIKIKSYLFNINIEKESFLKYLNEAGYLKSSEGDFGIFLNNEKFINKSNSSLADLYGFKKIMQNENIITPIFEDVSDSSLLIKFTSLIPEDLIDIDFILPPKSTWITPRL